MRIKKVILKNEKLRLLRRNLRAVLYTAVENRFEQVSEMIRVFEKGKDIFIVKYSKERYIKEVRKLGKAKNKFLLLLDDFQCASRLGCYSSLDSIDNGAGGEVDFFYQDFAYVPDVLGGKICLRCFDENFGHLPLEFIDQISRQSKKRTCFKCGGKLSFTSFYIANDRKGMNKETIVKNWNNDSFEFYCCGCFQEETGDYESIFRTEY